MTLGSPNSADYCDSAPTVDGGMMGKLIGSAASLIVAVGIVWGLIQLLGDDSEFLSPEWWETSTGKIQDLQEDSDRKAKELLPNYDDVTE